MKNIAAVIVDTYPRNQLVRLAIDQAVATGLVTRVHTFATHPVYPGEEFHCINPISSAADYSHFMLNIVPYCVDADHVLVIQWDGMPHDPAQWHDDFLHYDYIGAPWSDAQDQITVGNGGFSLRSRKLMQALVKLKIRCPLDMEDGDAEDVVICRHYRNALLAQDCTFAPHALAQTFSVENQGHAHKTFGFHGVFNMPRYLPERKLLGTAAEICERTSRDLFLINFLVACVNANYRDLFSEVRHVLQSSDRYGRIGSLMQQAHFDLPGY